MLWRDTVLKLRSEIVKKGEESLLMRRWDPRKTLRMREVSDSGPSWLRRRSSVGRHGVRQRTCRSGKTLTVKTRACVFVYCAVCELI